MTFNLLDGFASGRFVRNDNDLIAIWTKAEALHKPRRCGSCLFLREQS